MSKNLGTSYNLEDIAESLGLCVQDALRSGLVGGLNEHFGYDDQLVADIAGAVYAWRHRAVRVRQNRARKAGK